jgi:hypothetical protein
MPRQGSASEQSGFDFSEVVVCLPTVHQKSAILFVKDGTKAHFKSFLKNSSESKPSDQKEITGALRECFPRPLIKIVIEIAGGTGGGLVWSDEDPIGIRFFTLWRPLQSRQFTGLADLQFIFQEQKCCWGAPMIEEPICQGIPCFFDFASVLRVPMSIKTALRNIESEERGLQFSERTLSYFGGPTGGGPEKDSEEGEDAGESGDSTLRISKRPSDVRSARAEIKQKDFSPILGLAAITAIACLAIANSLYSIGFDLSQKPEWQWQGHIVVAIAIFIFCFGVFGLLTGLPWVAILWGTL